MNNEKKSLLSIFVGSSTQAYKRGILATLITEFSDSFSLMPWYEVFQQGSFTLETLLKLADEIDFAILIFSDDEKHSPDDEKHGIREIKDSITRDNVTLEFGIFVASLGRDRVCILKEEGVELPSDLAGVTYFDFPANKTKQKAKLKSSIQDLEKQWNNLNKRIRKTIIDDSNLGLSNTIKTIKSDIESLSSELTKYKRSKNGISKKPFYFDSSNACISTYSEALNLTHARFWTTTFLSSAFWARNDARAMEANEKLLFRMKNTGDVKRLFVLNRSPENEARVRAQDIIHLRQQNKFREIKRLKRELELLKDRVEKLIDDGCNVRFVWDEAEEWKNLPHQIRSNFNHLNSEIAIYDNRRVDIFQGERIGKISNVYIYSPAMKSFNAILRASEQFYSSLWNQAQPAREFLDYLAVAYKRAENRIDYTSNWIAKFEFDLDEDDRILKDWEMVEVENTISSHNLSGKIERYLDIGTCTARYPIRLREKVVQDGEIIGIDEDEDCVSFSKAHIHDKAKGDKRLKIKEIDFTWKKIPNLGKFDLITCMLGTISHFNIEKNLLESSILRMKDLLSPNGMLCISNWSRYACEHLKFLGIYSDSDKKRIAKWTPTTDELIECLETAQLSIVHSNPKGGRLDYFVCTHSN